MPQSLNIKANRPKMLCLKANTGLSAMAYRQKCYTYRVGQKSNTLLAFEIPLLLECCLIHNLHVEKCWGSERTMNTFLRATAGTAIARLSHRNSVRPSVCPSVRLSVTRVDQAKTVQARIIKSSPSAAPRTLVSGSVTLFQKFRRGHPNRGP